VASAEASVSAEGLARKEKNTEEYLEYYTFYYRREYIRIYKDLYKQYKEEYSKILLSRPYTRDDKVCQYHLESIQYEYELKKDSNQSVPQYSC
jgi:hypothetical protein